MRGLRAAGYAEGDASPSALPRQGSFWRRQPTFAPEPDALAQAIRGAAPTLQPTVFGSEVHVYTEADEPLTQEAMLRILLDAGIAVESIQASRRTLRNAYREVLAGHVV